jgi:hypothetical protein
MSEGRGEFRDLCGPSISILNVPAFLCLGCGSGRFSNRVLRRLFVILDAAIGFAEAQGLRELKWDFTSSGAPEAGGVPLPTRVAFARLRHLVAGERSLREATRQAAHAKPARLH